MSVQSEFQRVLGAYVDFLDASEAPGAQEFASTLREIQEEQHRAAAIGPALEHAATRVLGHCEAGGTAHRIRLRLVAETEQFQENTRHLATLCAAILGRPVSHAVRGDPA